MKRSTIYLINHYPLWDFIDRHFHQEAYFAPIWKRSKHRNPMDSYTCRRNNLLSIRLFGWTIYPLWKNDSLLSFSHRSLYLLCYFCNKCHFRLWLFPFALLRSPQRYMGSPFHVYILSKRPYLVHRLCIWSGSLSLKKRLLIGHLYFLMYLCQKFPRWSLQPDVSLERLE